MELAAKQIITPCELCPNAKTGMGYIRLQGPSIEGVELIWQSVNSWIEYIAPPRTSPLITSADQVWDLLSTIIAEPIELATIPAKNNNLKQRPIRPGDYDKLTPSGETNAIADLGPPAPDLADCIDFQSRINIIRGAHGPADPWRPG